MRLITNACIWAALAVAVWGTISTFSDSGRHRPPGSAKPRTGPGHPSNCPLCTDPGPTLPDEIDEYNVRLVFAA